MSGGLLAAVAFALVAGAGVLWYVRLNQVRAGEVRSVVIGLMAAAAAFAVAALVSSPGLVGGVLAGATLLVSIVFLALQPLSGQAPNTPAARVGERIVDFTATTDTGELFDLASLHGRPFLLKFFRGHW